ncbi:hypothetical protein BC833DRAFT_587408 [Globomyces pollinis-pini]|nr:hypothetical protein BC833DRAFT_587408 [Globomyces pollinis-pini]
MALLFALLKSSIPRILILVVNSLIIVVIGQLASPTPGTRNLNALVWSIKGAYPIILLFDIHTTKDMLMQSKNKTRCVYQPQVNYCQYQTKIPSRLLK